MLAETAGTPWTELGLAGAVIGALFLLIRHLLTAHKDERTEILDQHRKERTEWRDDASSREDKIKDVVSSLEVAIKEISKRAE